VTEATLADLSPESTADCLDAGCGEGYYLRQLAAAAKGRGQALALLGHLEMGGACGGEAGQPARLGVGSNANLPVLPGTLDRVLCMFGFPVYPELVPARRPADPGGCRPDLRELREIIYPSLKPERPASLAAPAGFRPAGGGDRPLHARTVQPGADCRPAGHDAPPLSRQRRRACPRHRPQAPEPDRGRAPDALRAKLRGSR
jgi:hypothetical protein